MHRRLLLSLPMSGANERPLLCLKKGALSLKPPRGTWQELSHSSEPEGRVRGGEVADHAEGTAGQVAGPIT